MTHETEALIARVLAHDAQATPGPWNSTPSGITQTKHVTRDVWLIPHKEEDMPLIADFRTAAPKLARMLREAMAGLVAASRQADLFAADPASDALTKIEKIARES